MQHRFADAAALYEQALGRAAAGGFEVTQAEIEDDLGQLALHQGKYERALDNLEHARRRFETLGMRHAAAAAQARLADAYLELSLVLEAVSGYERAVGVFRSLGMRADEAAALASLGRAHAVLGDRQQAHATLAEALRLFSSEDNEVGQASVRLAEAQLLYEQGEFERSATAAGRLCLTECNGARIKDALEYVERSRSRTLVDVLNGDVSVRLAPRDASEAAMLQRVQLLRPTRTSCTWPAMASSARTIRSFQRCAWPTAG